MTTRSKRSPKPRSSDLTIVLLSDTHECHSDADVPYGDLLIHAGDFTMMSRSAAALLDFNAWLGELPHRFKLVVPGNHEFVLEDSSRRSLISNATMLINEGTVVMGLKIWGSPTTPLYGGAFGLSSETERVKLYSLIPDGTDILITHGAPFGILDQAQGTDYHAGCQQLLDAVLRVKPKLHIFGHVHGGYGTFELPTRSS
jgi:Icc-related predicted phosphoesterase